jgi:MurNAc alpha-1-phosphate uridylyltransferase
MTVRLPATAAGPEATQVVVLAGGPGTRLLPLTHDVPKILATIGDKPFLLHLLALLERHGFRRFFFVLGHLGGMVQPVLDASGRIGARYTSLILDEPERHGTGGALRAAGPYCEEVFLLVYGDTYLDLDYRGLLEFFRLHPGLSVAMAAYDNQDGALRANLAIGPDEFVTDYRKDGGPGLTSVDAGVAVLRRSVLSDMPSILPLSYEEDVLPELIRRRQVAGYTTSRRFYDIGTPAGIRAFVDLVAQSPSSHRRRSDHESPDGG